MPVVVDFNSRGWQSISTGEEEKREKKRKKTKGNEEDFRKPIRSLHEQRNWLLFALSKDRRSDGETKKHGRFCANEYESLRVQVLPDWRGRWKRRTCSSGHCKFRDTTSKDYKRFLFESPTSVKRGYYLCTSKRLSYFHKIVKNPLFLSNKISLLRNGFSLANTWYRRNLKERASDNELIVGKSLSVKLRYLSTHVSMPLPWDSNESETRLFARLPRVGDNGNFCVRDHTKITRLEHRVDIYV